MIKLLLLFAIIFFNYASLPYLNKEFTISINRKFSDTSCTMGYLYIGDTAICHTLELPWLDNLNNLSCIPSGKYAGILRYDKNDRWRIQLSNVPNRNGVQLHIGNYTSETQGCILLGMEASISKCTVYNSHIAIDKLKKAFYGSENPNQTPIYKIYILVN